ncbi:hypothetical protein A3306_00185 [Rickettsia bellii]|uniref:Uncharacterized protein n=1 Tax=Rickettsia bellii str. RML An4 TaxID=1359193 RepID=A0A0F3Q9P2_RICBE|nr:hypothetical protein [Rickettsia bellii]ABV79429.1 hypothetical protein A1I_05510 [Rickettsia bellii OSU 85-389]ARD85725.1 hypothetical protein A3306_00185 [Rickettsia bellii]KJV89290.1 hypothetical protein RBEAN4_0261 [Rickettsia bellii str. RML An4]
MKIVKKDTKKIEFDKEKVQNLSLDAQKNRLEEYCKRKDLLLLSNNYVDNLSKNAKRMIEQKNKIKSD